MEAFSKVLEILAQSSSFGFRQLANGARLYGHVPHVAPEAWLHQLHGPLTGPDITSLEEAIGQPFPTSLRDFLELANGVSLFSHSLSIYGRRTSYVRTGDDAYQPFCIVTANVEERPNSAKPWQLVVGGYRYDGSLVSLDTRDGSAFRTKPRSAKIVNRWSSFWSMLMDETLRLSTLFDATGRLLADIPTTPPPPIEASK